MIRVRQNEKAVIQIEDKLEKKRKIERLPVLLAQRKH